MEQQVISQEILLVMGSSLCSRQFCRNNNNEEPNSSHSPMEELERACWDGLLYEMFPKLLCNSKNSYIWNTASGVNFLCISMGVSQMPIEKQASINPYNYFHFFSASFN